MNQKRLLLAFFTMLIVVLQGTLSAQSFRTVTFTGNTTDFTAAERYGAADNVDYYVTYDASNIYIGAFRTGGSSWGAFDHFTIYFDTDPNATITAGTGSTAGVNWDSNTPNMPFTSNYRVAIRRNGAGESFLSNWTGAVWNTGGTNAAGFTQFTSGAANGGLEIRIPWSTIGSPEGIYFSMYASFNTGYFGVPNPVVTRNVNNFTGYFGGIGTSSADCIPINTSNSPITFGITNGVPVSGATYGRVSVNTGTITNANNWTLAPGGSIVVSGGTLALGAQTITMGGGTSFSGRGTTINTSGAGAITSTNSTILSYNGEGNITGNNLTYNGTITARNSFRPLASGGFTLGSGGVFDLRGGAFIPANPINYAAGSTLSYNTGASYGVFNEWTTSGFGVPSNVIIGNTIASSGVNFGATASNYSCTGNLTIGSGIGSNLTLSTSTGNLSVGGNFTNNGTLTNANNRTLTLTGTNPNVGGTTATSFAGLTLTSGATLTNAITVNGALTLAGQLTLGAFNLTQGAAGTFAGASATNFIRTNSTGRLIVNGVTTARSFPVGFGTGTYSPLSITTGTSSNYTVGVTTTLPCALDDASRAIGLSWEVASSNATPTQIVYNWQAASAGGSFNATGLCDLGRYNAACPYTITTGAATASANSLTVNGAGNFGTGTSTYQYVVGNVGAISFPAPVASAATSITATSFNANWATVSGATGYYIDVSAFNTFASFVGIYNNLFISGGATITTPVTVPPGATYYYRLRAFNGTTSSASSNVITVNTPADETIANYRTRASGNYTGTSVWQFFDGTVWQNTTIAPGSNNNVDILSSHIVTLDVSPTIGTGKVLTVNSGGGLITSTFQVNGLGEFNLASGANITIGNTAGINSSGASGAVQTSIRTFSSGANYTYNGTANQSSGTFTTTPTANTVNSLSVSLSASFTLTMSFSGLTTPTLNLTSGLLAIGNAQTLNISTTGIVNDTGGDFATGATGGTLNFNGSGVINGNSSPYNVFASGGVNFGAQTVTIQNGGTFRINSGGFINTNAPFYAVGATLQYNTGGNYGRGAEWSAASGRGYPHNVTFSNNTTFQPGGNGNTGTVLNMGGNLNVNNGSNMFLDWGGQVTTVNFNVLGNVVMDGSISLSTTSGDWLIGGNFTRTGVLSPNNREVVFNGSLAQSITGVTTFDFIRVNNSSSTGLTLNNNIIVNQRFQTDDGNTYLGNNNITLNGSAFFSGGNETAYIVTGGSGSGVVTQPVNGGDDWFPVGTTTKFGPVTLNNSGTGDNISVRVVDAPTFTNAVNDNLQMVNLEWRITEAVSGGSNLRTTFGWFGAQGTNFDLLGAVYHGTFTAGDYVVRAANATSGTGPYFSLSTLSQPFTGSLNPTVNFVVGNINGIKSCYQTSAAGNWNTGANWVGGSFPPAEANVCLSHAMTLAAAPPNPSGITFNAGGSLSINNGVTLTFESPGFISNSSGITQNLTTGTIAFSNLGVVNGANAIAFNNLQLNGNTTFTTVPTINNEMEILPNGFVISSNGPNYGVSSTLKYNTGGPYNRSNEWRSTTGAGYPTNVLVTGNTALNIDAGTAVNRNISGNFQIDNGSSVSQGASAFDFTVLGNFTLNGSYTQSTNIGGDLILGGNWSSSATAVLNSNNRDVRFNGTGSQTISNLASGLTFGFLTIDNTASGVDLLNTITVNTFRVNAARTFNLSTDRIILTQFNITNPANLINNGTFNANSGTIEYTSVGNFTNNATFNRGTSTLDFTNGTVSINSGVQTSFNNVRCFTNGGIDFGVGGIRGRLFGTLELRAGSYIANNAPIYETGSLLLYNGGGTYNRNTEWDATTLKSVEVANNTTVVAGVNGTTFIHEMANNLTIGLGSTFRMTGPDMTAALRVRGNLINQGTLVLSAAPFGDLEVGGDFTNTGTFTSNNRNVTFIGTSVTPQSLSGVPSLFTAIMNNTGAGLNLTQALTVTNNLNLTNGDINLGNFNLTFSGTQANLIGGNANSYINTNGTGRLLQTVAGTAVRFPVGNTSYNPIALTNAGISDTYGVILNDGPAGSEVLATKVVQRNWDINEAVAGNSNLTIDAQWSAPIAQTGQEGALFVRNAAEKWIGRLSGGVWTQTAATLSGANPYTYSASGFTSLGVFEIGIANAFLPSDAGISAITLPTPICEGATVPVSVTVNNYGTDILNTVTVTLTIDGIAQTPVNLGTGIPLGIAASGNATLSIGSYIFPTGVTPIAVIATTSLPNGGTDANNANNSFTIGSQTIIQNVGTPSFTGGAANLCFGASSTYTATAANSTLIEYSIFSGGAVIDILTGVVSSVTSDFVVRATAYNACGTGVSNDFSVTVSPLILAPTFTTFNYNTATSVNISWVASATATSYFLEYGTSNTFGTSIFSGNIGNVLTYPVTALVAGNIYYYRVRAVNAVCGNSPWSDVTPFLTTAIVWEGTVGTDWNVPQNWSPFLVPTGSLDVEIFDRTNDPIIPTAGLNGLARNVTFNNSLGLATLVIQTGKSLNISGNLVSIGNTISGAGQVVFNGTGAQTLTGAATFQNLTIDKTSGTLSITSGMQSVRGIVRPNNGTLTTNGNLRLVSNAAATGIISGNGAGSISGNVEVNRYMPGPLGYRYVSSPITQAAGLTTADFDVSLVGANGLLWDPLFSIPSPFPNCWYYDESQLNTYAQYGWTSATPGALVTGRGYALITPANHTASLVGPVNNASVTATNPITKTGVQNGAGVNLIGNPYPSPISWNAFRALNGASEIAAVVKRFASTGSYYGQYVDWNGTVGTPGSVGDNIALGQAFFVTKINAGSTIINYNNSLRIDNTSTTFYETQAEVNNLLRLQLVGGAGADELVVYFDPTATNNYDVNYDAIKFLSETAGIPNIYTNIDTLKVSINVLESFNQDMVIPMGIAAKTAGNYQVNVVDMSTFAPSSTVYLEDRDLGTFTNLRTVNQYNVNLPVGEHNGRFFIHFRPAVEVAVTNETCQQTDGTVAVVNPSTEQQWNVSLLDIAGQVVAQSTEANTAFTNLNDGTYTLRITDASGYTVDQPVVIEAGQVVEANIAPMNSNYFYTTDLIEASVAQVITGMTYEWYLNGLLAGTGTEIALNVTEPGVYELMLKMSGATCIFQTSTSFSVTQESTVGIETAESASGFIIYPNPTRDILNVQINQKIGFNKLSIFDASGRLIHTEILNGAQGQQTIQVNLNELAAGLYQITLEGNQKRSTAKFSKTK